MNRFITSLLVMLTLFFVKQSVAQNWTLMKGNTSFNSINVRGTMGVENVTNTPGGRKGGAIWNDNNGNIWFFGGDDESFYYNDVWKYNKSSGNWTWMKGSSSTNVAGTYGTAGVANINNTPGSRANFGFTSDLNGDLWIYGGYGNASATTQGRLSDIWKFSVSNNTWTWISGSSMAGEAAVYSSLGAFSATSKPGGRSNHVLWKKGDSLYVYGGYVTASNIKNDTWAYNIQTNQWAWLKGSISSSTPHDLQNYGTKGVSSSATNPGDCYSASGCVDGSGNLWLMGGISFLRFTGTSTSIDGYYTNNQLWRFSPVTNEWTFMRGYVFTPTSQDAPSLGSINIESASNSPDHRVQGSGIAINGNALLFYGGINGNNSNGSIINDNDVWIYKISTNNWTRIKGDGVKNVGVNYGVIGVESSTNKPSGGLFPMMCTEPNGDLWVFGGVSRLVAGENAFVGAINNLWKLTTSVTLPTTLSSFNAKINNNLTNLQWQTSQEINTSHFEVEYCNNGKDFASVETVNALGSSSALHNYQAFHQVNAQPSHYYRLKMIDKDGKYTYSATVAINGNAANALNIVLHNTVVQNQLQFTVTSNKATTVNIAVKNSVGQTVLLPNKKSIATGSNSFSYSINNLNSGVYFLEMVDGSGAKQVVKFLK